MSVPRVRWTKKDQEFMRLALKLAEKGKGKTSPNPMVGAVVVKNGKVLVTGYHKQFGGSHAETVVIKACGNQAKNATLYTTLEPCCHFGKTPPCTELIIESGIKKVVCAIIDPNPRVNGKGLRHLTKKGIKVSLGLLAAESKRLNEVHFKYMTTGLPFVILQVNQSLNGKILRLGKSSGSKYKEELSRLFPFKDQPVDAILCDVDSWIPRSVAAFFKSNDSPNTRLILLGMRKEIERIVKTLPRNLHERVIGVLENDTTARVTAAKNLTIWKVKRIRHGEVDLSSLLKRAGKEGISSLLVDGGKKLSTSLLKRNLVDKVWYFISPQVQVKGNDPFGDLGIRKISECKVVKNCEFKQSPEGLLVVGYLAKPDSL